MKAYVYCRVGIYGRVPRNDRLLAQQDRARGYLLNRDIRRYFVYSDTGEMHPVELLPAMRKLLTAIAQDEGRILVVCDHKARLGKTGDIQQHVINLIQELGGEFISILTQGNLK